MALVSALQAWLELTECAEDAQQIVDTLQLSTNASVTQATFNEEESVLLTAPMTNTSKMVNVCHIASNRENSITTKSANVMKITNVSTVFASQAAFNSKLESTACAPAELDTSRHHGHQSANELTAQKVPHSTILVETVFQFANKTKYTSTEHANVCMDSIMLTLTETAPSTVRPLK